jgi:hypothetical protein
MLIDITVLLQQKMLPLTKQKTFMYFQRSYLSNSILTAGTLMKHATRFGNTNFPENGIVRLFARFKISKIDNAPPLVTETITKSFRLPADNEIKFEDEINTAVNNLNKNITDILRGRETRHIFFLTIIKGNRLIICFIILQNLRKKKKRLAIFIGNVHIKLQ